MNNEIIYKWTDCNVGFVCPQCGIDIIADAENGIEYCSCGLEYSLHWELKIKKGGH